MTKPIYYEKPLSCNLLLSIIDYNTSIINDIKKLLESDQ